MSILIQLSAVQRAEAATGVDRKLKHLRGTPWEQEPLELLQDQCKHSDQHWAYSHGESPLVIELALQYLGWGPALPCTTASGSPRRTAGRDSSTAMRTPAQGRLCDS